MSDKPSDMGEAKDAWSNDLLCRVGKRVFRCETCGANVFKKKIADPTLYKCNGCGERYRGKLE